MAKRLTDLERYHRSISERHLQDQVMDLARLYGWRVAHFSDSRKQVTRRDGTKLWVGDEDAKGWPDLVIARPPELLVIELKREQGVTTPDQDDWLADLKACGVETFVLRPSTWDVMADRLRRPGGRLDRVQKVSQKSSRNN